MIKKPRTPDIDEMAEELADAATLCDNELGEWWAALAGLVPHYRDGRSREFTKAVEAEITEQYECLKADFRIVETEVTRVETVRQLLHYEEEE